jgi:hypothetical protein
MHYYENAKWLSRIGTGAYIRLNEKPDINGALYALQKDLQLSVHTGGLSALALLYNKVQYAKINEKIQLFARHGTKLPSWFAKRYANLFELHTTNFLPEKEGMLLKEYSTFSLTVPSIERALLEMLLLVPDKVSVQEAYQIMELIQSVKPVLMQKLLEECTSVKVVRLLFCFADQAGLQWIQVLDKTRINFGSGVRTIEKGGKFNAAYKLVLL